MLKVFVGWDQRDIDAYEVCKKTLLDHASIPVEVIPIKEWEVRQQGVYWRAYHVDRDGQMWDAEIRRVDYDREETFRIWRESGLWESGIASRVFAYELQTANFHFWSYVRYCQKRDMPLNEAASFATYRKSLNGHPA